MNARLRKRRGGRFIAHVLLALVAAVVLNIIFRGASPRPAARDDSRRRDATVFKVTGYCNCGKCCGWKRSWFGFGPPVYNYGPMKGKPKKVGLTSSGKKASRGTVAADQKFFKYGEKLHIPGYGIGRVEDVGGAIKGRHIDLWFPTHEEARRWGVKWLKVTRVVE